jgi:hypothetical protein
MRDELRSEAMLMENQVETCQPTPEEKEYRPSKSELLRDYEISIQFLSRGCVVRVGCKAIAFEDVVTAMNEINAYVCGDTYEVQKKWRKLLDM